MGAEGTEKVLFVDDEENILKSLRRLTADEEFEVLLAHSAEEALDLVRSTDDLALIVSDQRMPGQTGVDFLQQAREIVPNAGRILLTGYADISATIDAINRGGAHRYISKPWNDHELISTLRESVRGYRLERENQRLSELVKQQNEELKEWNESLKSRVLEQTVFLREKINELHELNAKLGRNYRNVLAAFSCLQELHDQNAEKHCGNVADLSVAVARLSGMSEEKVEEIRVAALLHDIGEIGVSDNLLHGDESGMTEAEVREYRTHPVRGQAVVDSVEDLRPAGILIRHHHENFDGSGFPDGLAGSAIPLGARIIALADSIDRFYRENIGDNITETVLMELNRLAGSKFDPELLPLVKEPVKEHYAGTSAETGLIEMELPLRDLRKGMITAKQLRSGTGLLLLGAGVLLDEGKIQALKRYYVIDPPDTGVCVLVRQ
jgi:response regulator RpfG family c-di-GMP phosphodiesterase